MKKHLPFILTILFFGLMLLFSILMNSCNTQNKNSNVKRTCVIDSFYEKTPVALNEIQTTYVYHTNCGNIYTYNSRMYRVKDTVKY